MNAQLKAKWVAALRSGEYEQGQARLRRENLGTPRFCCLGVLCDVSGLGEWVDTTYHIDLGDDITDEGTYTLGDVQRVQLGIGIAQVETLTCLNDGDHIDVVNEDGRTWSFAEIADYIEREL